MEFLKTVLGQELFAQVEAKINEHNAAEKDESKHIKIANLGEGGYVSKDKHSALETEKNSIQEQLTAAQQLVDDYKKSSKNDEAAQQKITEYETKVTQLTTELEQAKLDSALKIALLQAKASDVDYLMFKIKQDGKELKLDDKGEIKGLDDIISSLKTQLPAQFESDSAGKKKIDENKLPGSNDDDEGEPQTLAEAIQQSYENND
nr:MAG TPA: minor structural protein [Caudoviricetes sp.]